MMEHLLQEALWVKSRKKKKRRKPNQQRRCSEDQQQVHGDHLKHKKQSPQMQNHQNQNLLNQSPQSQSHINQGLSNLSHIRRSQNSNLKNQSHLVVGIDLKEQLKQSNNKHNPQSLYKVRRNQLNRKMAGHSQVEIEKVNDTELVAIEITFNN